MSFHNHRRQTAETNAHAIFATNNFERDINGTNARRVLSVTEVIVLIKLKFIKLRVSTDL